MGKKKVKMMYRAPTIIEDILDFGHKLDGARELVLTDTDDHFDVYIKPIDNVLLSDNGISIQVDMEENQLNNLEDTLKTYLSHAGTPYFVRSGTDYKLMDRALGLYGKKTKRKIVGAGLGKWVVDN